MKKILFIGLLGMFLASCSKKECKECTEKLETQSFYYQQALYNYDAEPTAANKNQVTKSKQSYDEAYKAKENACK
jgi:hypothetical protein